MVQASRSHCGAGWTRAAAGTVQLRVRNSDVNAAEVYVADRSGKLYGEIDPLAPGATAVLTTALAAGSYHLVCSVNDGDPVNGPNVAVTGSARGAHGVQPVTSAELAPAVITYQGWVRRRLGTVQRRAARLTAALEAGNRPAAQAVWRATEHTWNTMGGAYNAFGKRGDAIDGTAFPFPGGVRDPHWTGLLRIEYGLWHGQSPASLATFGRRLEHDLGALDRTLATTQFEPLDVVNRTHEISEDTLQQTLTGHDDYGAHVELSDALAQLGGTTELLTVLHSLLVSRYPSLSTLLGQIGKVRKDIRAQHDWTATPGNHPPDSGHELVDGDLAQLAELLTPIPIMLEPRVTQS